MEKIQDLTGKKFGRLYVLEYVGKDKYYIKKWLCQCDCGHRKVISAGDLKSGRTQSCGCLQSESSKERFTTHGESNKSKEYYAWSHMKDRCSNPKCDCYRNYGSRGIKVCKRWNDSYADFLADMGRCPEGFSIDRRDNNGDYEPGNCRWVTRKEQNRNTRRNRLFTYKGKTKCLIEWAETFGVKYMTLWHYVNRRSCSISEALGIAQLRNNS